MDVLVVGAGVIGRWFGECLVDAHPVDDDAERLRVAFADTDLAAAEAAVEAVSERETVAGDDATDPIDPTPDARAIAIGPTDSTEPTEPTESTESTDTRAQASDTEHFETVCLAVPMPAIEGAIATHAGRAERAILDVTGVMSAPVAAMREHAPDLERVSLHPLFGPENAPGRIAVVADAPGPTTDAIREALATTGNHLFETTPAEHDGAMETVQARAHAAILAFALAAEDVPANYATPISEPLTELATQVTGGSPGVYADIQATFEGASDVAAAAERVATADREGFEELYREADVGGSRTDRTESEDR